MSGRSEHSSGRKSSAPVPAPDAAAEGGSSSLGEQHRRQMEEEAEHEALEMMEESAARAQQWGGSSNALHGLLRKLGAGLDDLLPSVSASHSHLKSILAGLKTEDDGIQLASLTELCELLSIGTEDSMSTMSVDVFVPLLVQLFRKEHNADIMLLASRAMCHMMDAIPSSSAAVVHYDGVQLFCERLLSIEYIDLAEQALQALEKLSHEHPVAILRAGGMIAVLQYVDFFAMGVQRLAVSTAANLCRGLPVECAHLVIDAVPLLSGLLNHQDQKVLEHICLAFSRLVEAFAHAPAQLDMLAAHSLLPNLLRLLSGIVGGTHALDDAHVTLSDATYTMLLRTLATLCRGSACLCKQLLHLGVCSVLQQALVMADESSRPHDQVFQLLSLANELLPPLPKPDPERMAVSAFGTGAGSCGGASGAAASAASSTGSGTPSRRSLVPKRRSKRNSPEASSEKDEAPVAKAAPPPSERERAFLEEPELLTQYSKALFAILLRVHRSAVNAPVRQKCLSCVTKVLHFYPAPHLDGLLERLPFAAFVAPLLSPQEPPTAMAALQMTEILLTKLPQVYGEKLLREGVFHAVATLRAAADPGAPAPAKNAAALAVAAPATRATPPKRASSRKAADSEPGSAASAAPSGGTASSGSAADSRGRALGLRRTGAASREPDGVEAAPASAAALSLLVRGAGFPRDANEQVLALGLRAARFEDLFVRNNPALSAVSLSEGSATLRTLRSLAAQLNDPSLYSTQNPNVPLAGSLDTFADVQALQQLALLVAEHEGISTFELANSGLNDALLRYLGVGSELSENSLPERRHTRLRSFSHILLGLPAPSLPNAVRTQSKSALAPLAPLPAPPTVGGPELLQLLVSKLQDALNMLERFPLALTDSAGGDGSASGLKALTQPLKLRLQRTPGAALGLKEYANNVVLIEPLATVAAIEDFLWPKVRRDTALRNAAGQKVGQPESSNDGPDGAPARAAEAAGSSGSAGKQPARGRGKAAMVDAADGEDDEDDADDDEDEDEDEDEDDAEADQDEDDGDDEGSMLSSSPALAPALDSGECVHDLQLNSPERRPVGQAKAPSSFQLPSSPASGVTEGSATRTGGVRAGSSNINQGGGGSGSAAAPAGASQLATTAPEVGTAPPSGSGHHLELLLNGQVLPYTMTIFQAIRQHGTAAALRESGAGAGPPSGSQRLWADVYTITYRLIAAPTDGVDASAASGPDAPACQRPEPIDACDAEVRREVHVTAHDADPLTSKLALPAVLPPDDPASSALQLLRLLFELNSHWPCLFDAVELAQLVRQSGSVLPPPAFLNRQLNAKLMRQLQDPLALCARSLPSWCAVLVSNCPFLFTFDSRRLFLHLTAFGLSRALQRLQQHTYDGASGGSAHGSSERAEFRLGRLARQKVRISRSRVMDSAFKVMELYASHKALLEVEYFNEVGTGLGPTLEFYTLVSRELQRAELQLWLHEEPSHEAMEDGDAAKAKNTGYVFAPTGLFPRAVPQQLDGSGVSSRVLQLFTFMGRFMAKAMLDNRLVDLPFSAPFYRFLLGCDLGMDDLRELSPQLARSLSQLQELSTQRAALLSTGGTQADVQSLTLHGMPVSELGLDFTLPGQPSFELLPGGAHRDVTIDNLAEYVQLVLQTTLLGGVRAQMAALQRGFSEVFPVERLRAFSPDELDVLFNGTRERWEREVVVEHLKFDHGYTRASPAVGYLLDVLSSFSDEQLSQFLKFVTGSPRLPVGGLARLSPRLTIVLKRPENGVSPDAYLPSVMTCANYLKLPDYSSKEVMRERMLTAINEGQGCFLLS